MHIVIPQRNFGCENQNHLVASQVGSGSGRALSRNGSSGKYIHAIIHPMYLISACMLGV